MNSKKSYHGICEECEYYDIADDDEGLGEKICHASLDEDDYRLYLMGDFSKGCPYFKPYDEYKTVAKQN